MQKLVKNCLNGLEINKLKRRFKTFCDKVIKDYKEFLFRLAGRDIPLEWRKQTNYNQRVSAERKVAKLEYKQVSQCK